MSLIQDELKEINETIYRSLYGMLKKFNKQFHLKLYAIVLDETDGHIDTFRVKKTISDSNSLDYGVKLERLPNFDNMFRDVQVENVYVNDSKKLRQEIEEYLNIHLVKLNNKTVRSDTTITDPEQMNENRMVGSLNSTKNESRILYANQLKIRHEEQRYSIVYVLEIRNLDAATIDLFYFEPEFSFLRMALDYFFIDFFRFDGVDCLIRNDRAELRTRYNEDSTQFTRRMSRIFFGKIHSYLQEGYEKQENPKFANDVNSVYYVNDLQEKIDDISTNTYEGNSPFGSILLCHRSLILGNTNRIKFTIKFVDGDWIKLEDSKRVRKLLELTDEKQDLYLIADHQYVYGLGEVNWGQMQDVLTLRLSFKGISKYDLSIVNLDSKTKEHGKIITDGAEKMYQFKLRLVDKSLLSISFKNPKIGEDNFSTQKLRTLLHSQLFDVEFHESSSPRIQALENIIQKAREQKHGTMVVITEHNTAEVELQRLKRQSTLIEKSIINLEYIKHLTSIDGAIYFDKNGACHGVGVILDGIAQENYGDASRGARYNSAHRYHEKLKAEQKKCVIAIISEDGMVDLIPDLDSEDKIFGLVHEIIDMINENADQNALDIKEQELANYTPVEYDLFFKIASAFSEKKNYGKCLEFCLRGNNSAGEQFISSEHLRLQAKSHVFIGGEENINQAIFYFEKSLQLVEDLAEKAKDHMNIAISKGQLTFEEGHHNKKATLLEAQRSINKSINIYTDNNIGGSDGAYGVRGLIYRQLADLEEDSEKKKTYYACALSDFSKAISLNNRGELHYSNRAMLYEKLGQYKDSVEDLIQAALLEPDESYRDRINSLLQQHQEIRAAAVSYYQEKCHDFETNTELKQVIDEYTQIIEEQSISNEVAATEE